MRQPVPFGKYLLLDRISVGGMAEVFKAKSYGVEGFEKIIAIKRILPTMGEDRDFIKMFIDEAKIAGQLAHANICQIFELGRIDGSHFIAMEYIWGKDLLQIQNRLRKTKQQMPINMACFVISKVLEGLDYAHRKRDPLGRPLEIVHRDCSPQNVLVSYEGEVKVIDFGIAKATSRNSRTMAGVLKGKFGYMSPEQVRGLPLDRRSDIFAIGTMLYECLTGERLFQGETDFSTLEKVRNVDIAAPRQVNPNIPEAIEKIILKALAKDVEDRYQWCSEMLADLQAFLMSQDVVFTAKSLSSWLKEVFAAEIERERQLLEQYKRVGRDGLIAGVPSAQAKLDVVEHLGEAGPTEGDPTVLGGPNFDDIEKDTGAAPELQPRPAAGGPRGSVHKKGAAAPTPVGYQEDEEGEGDFGEEAPTEIFGETESPPPPAPEPQPAVGRVSSREISRPTTIPPRPPPGAPPVMDAPQPMAAAHAPTMGGLQDGLAAAPAYNPAAYAHPLGTPSGIQPAMAGPPPGQPMALGTPGSVNAQPGPDGQPAPQRTVLGVQAPVNVANYAAYRPSQPMPAQHQSGAHAMPHGYPQGSYPSYPPSGPYPQPYGYASGPMAALPMGAAPVDPSLVMVAPKRSTLVRDIAIGVGIAAFVLVGFLVVKLLVLDDSKSGKQPVAASKFATVKLAMPAGLSAEMFVDGERIATVTSESPGIPITAGIKHIRLVGTNGLSCDDPKVKLEAGKTTTLECNFGVTSGKGPGNDTQPDNTGSQVAQGVPPAEPAPQDPVGTKDGADAKAPDAQKSDPALDVKSPEKSPDKSNDKSNDKAPEKANDKSPDKSNEKSNDKPDAKSPVKTIDAKSVKMADDKALDAKKSADAKKADPKTQDKKVVDAKASDASKAADGEKGYLQVFSKPPAKILIDGQDTNLKTPISGQTLALTPGKHKVTFVIGDDRFTYPVVIKAGVTETMSKDLQ